MGLEAAHRKEINKMLQSFLEGLLNGLKIMAAIVGGIILFGITSSCILVPIILAAAYSPWYLSLLLIGGPILYSIIYMLNNGFKG